MLKSNTVEGPRHGPVRVHEVRPAPPQAGYRGAHIY